MARSSYIYIYMNNGMAIAAFTVKYECQNYIKSLNGQNGYVIRLLDGINIEKPDSFRYYTLDEFIVGDKNE